MRDPKICGGEPVIKGTRVTLRTILASLAEGASIQEILEDIPTLTERDVRAVIAFAATSAEEDLPVPSIPNIHPLADAVNTEPHGSGDAMEGMRRRYRLNEEERARLREQLTRELATHADVAFAYLYGSFGESDVFHDVDVGVYFSPPPPTGARASALAQSLSDRAKLPVDVRPLNGAPVSFVYHVLRGQLLLSRDDALLAEVMEQTVRQYLDIAPLLRQSTKEAFAP